MKINDARKKSGFTRVDLAAIAAIIGMLTLLGAQKLGAAPKGQLKGWLESVL